MKRKCISLLLVLALSLLWLPPAGALDAAAVSTEQQLQQALTASGSAEQRLRCGNRIRCTAREGNYRVYSESGEFLLFGQVSGGELKTIKSFFEV